VKERENKKKSKNGRGRVEREGDLFFLNWKREKEEREGDF
jgi:hypothetical protein